MLGKFRKSLGKHVSANGFMLLFVHSVMSNSATPWTVTCQAFLSFSISWACSNLCPLSEWCHPNISYTIVPFAYCLQSFPASVRVFSNKSVLCIRWPKFCSFSFSISSFNEYLGLISFRMDWLDHLAVQGTLKSLLQHHSSKASILLHSNFFIVQLSHPYMTTGKTITLTRWTFVGKVTSLLFKMLSMLVITFLPRSKHLLILWLRSPSAVILEPRKIKSATVSPSICHEWITTNCGKFFKRSEYQTTWPASWEICVQFRKQQLGLDMEQQIGSK